MSKPYTNIPRYRTIYIDQLGMVDMSQIVIIETLGLFVVHSRDCSQDSIGIALNWAYAVKDYFRLKTKFDLKKLIDDAASLVKDKYLGNSEVL